MRNADFGIGRTTLVVFVLSAPRHKLIDATKAIQAASNTAVRLRRRLIPEMILFMATPGLRGSTLASGRTIFPCRHLFDSRRERDPGSGCKTTYIDSQNPKQTCRCRDNNLSRTRPGSPVCKEI